MGAPHNEQEEVHSSFTDELSQRFFNTLEVLRTWLLEMFEFGVGEEWVPIRAHEDWDPHMNQVYHRVVLATWSIRSRKVTIQSNDGRRKPFFLNGWTK